MLFDKEISTPIYDDQGIVIGQDTHTVVDPTQIQVVADNLPVVFALGRSGVRHCGLSIGYM